MNYTSTRGNYSVVKSTNVTVRQPYEDAVNVTTYRTYGALNHTNDVDVVDLFRYTQPSG